MHTLNNRTEQQTNGKIKRFNYTYGYAVVFPHDNYQGPEPPSTQSLNYFRVQSFEFYPGVGGGKLPIDRT